MLGVKSYDSTEDIRVAIDKKMKPISSKLKVYFFSLTIIDGIELAENSILATVNKEKIGELEKAGRVLLNAKSRADYDKGSKRVILGEYCTYIDFYKKCPF